jgi:hypothetical protein
MQKRFFLLILLGSLLTGCAPKTESSLERYRMPTDVPSAASLAETAQAETAARTPPDSCPVSVPQDPPFTPPTPYSELAHEGYFWYGSNALWASLPQDGVWHSLPQNEHGYGQKLPWWREGYVWDEEPQPDLIVTGERLDAEAPPLLASKATNAYADDIGSAMLVGVAFPILGCWRITGQYGEAELSFVVWVAP